MRDEEQLYKEFDQLIGRHRRLIRFLCQRASYGREAHCRDLIQECYVAMLKHLPMRTTHLLISRFPSKTSSASPRA